MLKHFLFLAVCQVFFLYSAIYAQDNIAVNKKSPKIIYGTASFYASKFKGRMTANGETFNYDNLTAACNVLPLGTWIRVTNLRNRRTVVLKVNDRLHPKTKRVVDLTHFAAQKLNFIKSGLTRVKVEVLGRKKPAN
jgi:rare lipoprotein A